MGISKIRGLEGSPTHMIDQEHYVRYPQSKGNPAPRPYPSKDHTNGMNGLGIIDSRVTG